MTSRKYIFALRIVAAALIGAGGLLGARHASAQEPLPPINGPTATGEICMQKVFGTPVAKSNELNCTANDIQLSRAISVFPESCMRGETITLTATFETIVTANARYDAGFFFRIDGEEDGTARGDGPQATGTCSLSALEFPPLPALDLDGDTCDDLNAGTYNLTFTIPGVVCEPGEGTNELRLPNCTSWHSNKGTTCDIDELNVDPPVAADLDLEPENKSKCVCDDDFTVPVIVEEATISVVKTANPTTVPESGGLVTYTIEITNDAQFEPVYIDSILDDLYGNLVTNETVGVEENTNTCTTLFGAELQPGVSASCSFQAFVTGDAGEQVKDIVEACAIQLDVPEGTPPACGSDDAIVTILDEFEPPSLTKSVVAKSCLMDVEYRVVITNNSESDTLTVNTVTDNMFGAITATHGPINGFGAVTDTNCLNLLGDILPLGQRSCEFTGQIQSPGCSLAGHTNVVTATTTDDDGVDSSPSGSATVTLSSTP